MVVAAVIKSNEEGLGSGIPFLTYSQMAFFFFSTHVYKTSKSRPFIVGNPNTAAAYSYK